LDYFINFTYPRKKQLDNCLFQNSIFMKKFFKKHLFLISVLIFTNSSSILASHVAGGDITYNYLGGNQYQVNLTLYVDCQGFDPGVSQVVNFINTCGQDTSLAINVTNPGGTEISQLCPAQMNNSTCNGGTLPGMWIFNYTGVMTLATACDTWTISWAMCCRNNSVINLDASSSASIYIETTLNSVTSPSNNSAYFNSNVIPFVCANQPVNYNFGVMDSDGDSLFYSLVSALAGPGSNLVYTSGYSASSPIPGITINSSTGQFNFTPVTLGNFVVVMKVQEYNSSGNLVGSVMRDIQFNVQNCTNIPPDASAGSISNFTGTALQTGPNSIQMCAGNNFAFDAVFNDADSTDMLSYQSDIATLLPGATVTSSGTNPLTLHIEWNSPVATPSANISFNIIIKDGACPIIGEQSFAYMVNINERTAAGLDQNICDGLSAILHASGGTSFTWSVLSGPPMIVGTNFSCNNCADPVASPLSTTTYLLTSNLSGSCTNKDTVTINVGQDFSYSLTQSDTVICLQQSVQFFVNGSAGTYTYQWSPSISLNNDTIANPTATLNLAGTFNYFVSISNAGGCVKKDTVSVIVEPIIRTVASNDTVLCNSESVNISVTGGSSFAWNVLSGPPMILGSDFSCNNCSNPTAAPNSTTIYEVTSDLVGSCINRDTVTVSVVPDFSFDLTTSSEVTCLNGLVELNVINLAPAVSGYLYQWSPPIFLNNTSIANPLATITIPGTYNYEVAITSPDGCVTKDTLQIIALNRLAPTPTISTSDSSACVGDTVQLNVVYGFNVPATCGLSASGCAGSAESIVGVVSGTNTATTWPAPYGNWYTSEKHQMLFRASELNAAGITGGKIDKLSFEVTTIAGITAYHQFTIKMGCTNLNTLGSTWVGGLFQVFDPATVNITVGWNTHVFNNVFEWDGISNIVVEICSTEGPGGFGYSNYTQSSSTPYATTSFTSCLYSYTDVNDMCPDTVNWITPTNNRPVVKFNYCSITSSSADYVYSWTPIAGLSSPGSQITNAIVSSGTIYTVVVTDTITGCSGTNTIQMSTCAGVNDLNNLKLLIYPSPVSDVLNISNPQSLILDYAIYDLTGKLVVEQARTVNSLTEVNTSFLEKGIYFLQINYNNETLNYKVIKQ
jgi:hypothetical protein